MYHDEIIEEVWKNRETLAKRCHHSLHEIVLDMQRRQKTPESGSYSQYGRDSGPSAADKAAACRAASTRHTMLPRKKLKKSSKIFGWRQSNPMTKLNPYVE